MSSENKLVSLTKYIMTLPPTRISLFSMVFLSFIIGCIAFLLAPSSNDSILYSIVYGGSTGFLIFGLMSIMGGGLTQPMVNSFKGRHMKMKQSMFLALASMMIVGVIYLIGSVVSVFTVNNYVLNALIFGCVIAFAFRTLVIWGTSNISLLKSVVISVVQPALILSMLVVISFLTSVTTNMGDFSIIAIYYLE